MMNGDTGLFGALYLRISRAKGENEDTLQNHRELMQEFCREHGYTFEIYEEIVSGGKHQLEARPQLQKLIHNIERYEAIFVVALDRLSRNGFVSQLIKKACIDHDVKIITPTQTFDLAGSEGSRLLYDISSMYAVMEYEMIGRRTKTNKLQRAVRGEHVSGQAAYGYRRNPDTRQLEIYEPEAGVVRYMFKLYLQGFSCRKIADLLNGDGFKTQQLHDYLPTNIQTILRNPVYKGTLVYRDRKRIREGNVYSYKVLETIITEHVHPAIISPDQWEEANRKRVKSEQTGTFTREKPAGQTGATMLKDLLFCGRCGKKLEIAKRKNDTLFIRHCRHVLPDSRMKCNNQGMKLQLLEEKVLSELQRHKEHRLAALLQQQELRNSLMDLKERLLLIEHQLQENEQAQPQLIEVGRAKITIQEKMKIVMKVKALMEQRPLLYESKEKLRRQIRNLETMPQAELTAHRSGSFETFQSLPAEKQNEILKQFVPRIHYVRVMPEEIRKLPVRSPERQAYPFHFIIEYF
ncbi:recombinase family protein [Paenibacillus enshidis]|uniref:Recombinase family protein n=1 Tax=Paenibacillus enshidis TaxID=1458439 RepID=A0ABV5AXC0_9BACL